MLKPSTNLARKPFLFFRGRIIFRYTPRLRGDRCLPILRPRKMNRVRLGGRPHAGRSPRVGRWAKGVWDGMEKLLLEYLPILLFLGIATALGGALILLLWWSPRQARSGKAVRL